VGPYWAIGCLVQTYRIIAVIGVVASLALIPITAGYSLFGLLFVAAFIIAAQFFRLLIDIAQSSRGTYEVLKMRSGGRVPPDPNGPWQDANLRSDLQRLQQRGQNRQAFDDDDFAPRPRR
jgi:hypothetical protein